MRWQGQKLESVSDDALPGLARLNNLVRSVQTPEFAGITFHEVLAKSALNHVPGTSRRMPNAWTINPYRGCQHACVYCLSPDTQITMADGGQLPLWMLKPGDEVIGTVSDGDYRRYVRSKVLAKWDTRKRAYRITLADGTEIVASGDHRFLTNRGWKYVRGAMAGAEQRPYLTLNNRLLGFGAGGPPGNLLFRLTESATTPELSAEDLRVKSFADLRIVSIEDLGEVIDMIDITTETGDFIANGVISHNCFARPTHTYLDLNVGKDFDTQIVVKVNVGEVLEKEVAKPSWRADPQPVQLGTNTDPYQRAEGRYKLMPQIIETLASSGTPLSILTKGTLLRRDLPLLRQAAEQVPVGLAMSIAVFDDDLQQSIEPGTPRYKERLATVTAVREAGLDCMVFLMPILPFLTDSREHLDFALSRIRAAGASSVLYTALHLRGPVKPWFFFWLEREHPELIERYRGLYGDRAYASKDYRRWLAGRIKPLIRKHGLEHAREDPTTGGMAAVPPSSEGGEAAYRIAASLSLTQPTLF